MHLVYVYLYIINIRMTEMSGFNDAFYTCILCMYCISIIIVD